MDIFSKEKRSEIMSKIRGKGTKPEMVMHGILKGRRVRHKMWPDLTGRPDVLIYARRDLPATCIFVNGCFWHGCAMHFRAPKTNKRFWADKIEGNATRQRRSVRALQKEGYSVRVVWEHEVAAKGARIARESWKS